MEPKDQEQPVDMSRRARRFRKKFFDSRVRKYQKRLAKIQFMRRTDYWRFNHPEEERDDNAQEGNTSNGEPSSSDLNQKQ